MSHIQLQPSTTPVPEARGWTPSVKPADKAADVMSQLEVMTARSDVAVQLRRILYELAHREDDIAASEAAAVPYWAPLPASVSGHREAAIALRSEADRLLEAS